MLPVGQFDFHKGVGCLATFVHNWQIARSFYLDTHFAWHFLFDKCSDTPTNLHAWSGQLHPTYVLTYIQYAAKFTCATLCYYNFSNVFHFSF